MGNILAHFAKRHDLILEHGKNLHVIGTLFLNGIRLLRLKLYKGLHGIKKPIVHYYAVCWNEEKLLPFMFQHYDAIVDHYTIYDNYSDDHSEEIVQSHENTSIIKYSMNGQIDDAVYQRIKNNCWKKSRGRADYVIVGDIDEFLYSKDLRQTIEELNEQGVSLVKPEGYNMYSESYPAFLPDIPITRQVTRGIRTSKFDKCILFDPHAVAEINFEPGAHVCHPLGRIKSIAQGEVKLLHYKYLGVNWLIARSRQYAQRLSQDNIDNGLGMEYLEKEETLKKEFATNFQQAVPVI